LRQRIFKIIFVFFLFSPVVLGQTFNDFYELLKKNDIAGMKEFIQKCENPDLTDSIGSTILTHVCYYENLKEIFDLLLKKGANANAKNYYNQTPLFVASQNSYYYTEQLLKKGANVNIVDFQGQTPLFSTIINQLFTENLDFKIIDLLLKYGANINVQMIPPKSWKPPENSPVVIEVDTENEGATPLMFAVMVNNIEMVKYLLKHGANPNIKTKKGETALSLAKREGFTEIIKLLKQYSKK